MRRERRRSGFTLIELMTVIAIILLVAAMSLPYFAAMMKGRQWTSAVSTIQIMVTRARALATNVRSDMSVEFNIQGDNGTTLWMESESNLVETLDDLNTMFNNLGGAINPGAANNALKFLTDPGTGPWYASGGRVAGTYTYTSNPALTDSTKYGDNARQSEVVSLSRTLTIDPSLTWSPNFLNWDARALPDGSTRPYGGDDTNDIRIAPNGALSQTVEPTICLKQIRGNERLQVLVVRCTGRVLRKH